MLHLLCICFNPCVNALFVSNGASSGCMSVDKDQNYSSVWHRAFHCFYQMKYQNVWTREKGFVDSFDEEYLLYLFKAVI